MLVIPSEAEITFFEFFFDSWSREAKGVETGEDCPLNLMYETITMYLKMTSEIF